MCIDENQFKNNMDSHSYRNVHDENPLEYGSHSYKDVHDEHRYKNNMDSHSYKDVHDENPYKNIY